MVLRDPEGRVAACAPMYAKSHSYGEYVFDHGWAHAFERAGGNYYPKLQIAAPFSPVPGPRLLIRPDSQLPPAALAGALVQACGELGLSSAHITFCTRPEWDALGEAGWLQRMGMQFHWENAGYGCFDDFLGALASRKRKSLRRERRDAQNCGLEFVTLRGGDIGKKDWDAFYGFYTSTVDRKWGSAYLTRKFFSLLSERVGDAVVLMMARQGEHWVAGALNLLGDEALYGRNWGCKGDWPFLHFELCYYQAIDFAIAHGLPRVEAGAQGEHKIQRGYLPKPTYSAHYISHPGLRRAIADFVEHERIAREGEMAQLAELSPFRRGGEAE
jgi:predicted N-acyltransferase